MAAKSRSARYYASNPKARAKTKSYDTSYGKTTKRKKYRAALNKENHKRGTYGNGDGKDVIHKKNGKTTREKASKNRARNGDNGKSSKK